MQEKVEQLTGALFIAIYWAIGGYGISWFAPDPYPSIVIRLSVAIGLIFYAIGVAYEDAQEQIPVYIGCLIIAPPGTMIFAGLVTWGLSLLGVVQSFRR